MKKYVMRAIAACLLVALFVGFVSGVPFDVLRVSADASDVPTDIEGKPIVNLMEGMNEKFEKYTIPGWSVMDGVVQSDEHLYGEGGVWALKLNDSLATASTWSVSDKNPIEAGKSYTISAQVYGGIGQMTVYFYDASGNELPDLTISLATETAAEEWQELYAEFTADANATQLAVKVSTTDAGTAPVWFDAVILANSASDEFQLEFPNGDFNEPWTGKIAPGWVYTGNNASMYDKGNGDLALAVKRNNTTYTIKSERFEILGGKAYTVTVDLLQTAEMNGQVHIKFYTDATTTTAISLASANRGFVTFGGAGTTEEWVTVAANAIAPANATHAEVWITSPWKVGTDAEPEYSYFDNVNFTFASELFNPSYESKVAQSDGTPMGISTALGVADAVTNADAHTGTQALMPTNSKLFYSFYVNVVAGEMYDATAFAKLVDATAADSTCSVAIYFYDENATLIVNKQFNGKPTFSDWTELKMSYKAPDNAVAARVMVYKANGSGRAYFDDVALVQTTDYNMGRNYLNNGGFESRPVANNSPIPNWLSASSTGADYFALDYIGGAYGYSGRAYGTDYVTLWSDPIAITAGKTYSVTVEAAGEGQMQAYIRYYTSADAGRNDYMKDEGGTALGKFKSTGNLSGEWTQLQVSGSVAPEGATHVRILLCFLDDNISEVMNFNFDNVCFFEGLPKWIVPGETGVMWNPGFEELDKNGLPVNWSTFGQNRISIVDANVNPDDVYEGRYALSINVPAELSGTHGIQSNYFPVNEGITYRFSLYAKEDYDEGRGFQLHIKYFDKYGDQLAQFYSTTPATGEWNYSEVTATAPDGAVAARLMMVSGAGKGTVCFDKMNFEVAGSAEYAPVMFEGDWEIAYNQYPRLNFDQEGLERIQRFGKSKTVCAYGYAGTVTLKSLLTTADTYMEETMFTISHKGIQLDYQLYPKLEDYSARPEYATPPEGFSGAYPYTTAVSQRVVARTQTLALAYAITGEEKYGVRAVQYALDICDFEYWVGYYANVVEGGNKEWSSQMTGYMVDCVLAAYDMCYDLLSEEDIAKMEEALIVKGMEAMYHDCWARMIRDRDMDHATAMILAACTILDEDNIDQLSKYLDMGMTYVNWRLNFFLKSGVNEGNMYDSLAVDDIVKTLYTLERVTGYTGPLDHPYMEQLKTRVLGFFDPVNGTLPAYSDSDFASHYYPYSMAVFSQQGDELATYYLAVGGALDSSYDKLIWFTDIPLSELKTPDERVGNVNYLSAHGQGSLRTGWDILDPVLVINANTSEQEHNHYDQNSLLLAFNGLWVLSDSEYKDNSYSTLTTWQMKYTNSTIFVDSKPQVRKGQGSLDQVFDTHIYGYFIGSAPDAYGMEDKQAVLNKFDRHTIMINHDSQPYYIVIDDLDSNKERNFGWNFFTNGWDRIEIDGEQVVEGESATGNRLTLSRFGNTLHSYFVGDQVTTKEVSYDGYGPTLVLESPKAENYQFMNVLSIQKGSGSQISTLFEHMMVGQSSTMPTNNVEGQINWSTRRTDTTKNAILSVSIGTPLVMFRAGEIGDWIEFPFSVPKTKEYRVSVDVGQTMEYNGTWNLYIDGQLMEIFKPHGPSGVITIDCGYMTLEEGQHSVKVIMSGTPNTAFFGTIMSVGGITLDTGESMGEGVVKVQEEYNEGDLLGATITYGPVLKDVVVFNRGTNEISGGGLTTNGQQASIIGINGNDIAEGYAVTNGTSLKYGNQVLMTSEGLVSVAMDYTMAKFPVKNDDSVDPVAIHEDFDIENPVYYVSASAEKATKVSINVGIHAPYTVYIGDEVIESTHSGEMVTFTLPAGSHQITIKGTHQHVFNQHATNILNIKDWAGCGHANVYYVSCECGMNGVETFADGAVKGHNVKLIKATEAADGYAGNIEHYKCSTCGKLFADKAATQELSESDVILTGGINWLTIVLIAVAIVGGIAVIGGAAVIVIVVVKKKKSKTT